MDQPLLWFMIVALALLSLGLWFKRGEDQRELHRTRSDRDQLRVAHDGLQALYAQAIQDRSIAQGNLTAKQQQYVTLEARLTDVNTRLAQLNGEVATLKSQLDVAQRAAASVEALRTQQTDLHTRLADALHLADDRLAALDQIHAESADLKTQLTDVQQLAAERRDTLEQAITDRGDLQARLDEALQLLAERESALNQVRSEPAALSASLDVQPPAAKRSRARADDLLVISGLDPVFAQKLSKGKIRNYQQLAEATPEQIDAIVQAEEWNKPNYAAWISEAADLVKGLGPHQLEPPDNLEVINGIGPVYATKLIRGGVRTFRQLATATPAQLHKILKAPEWRTPDYADWIKQAKKLVK